MATTYTDQDLEKFPEPKQATFEDLKRYPELAKGKVTTAPLPSREEATKPSVLPTRGLVPIQPYSTKISVPTATPKRVSAREQMANLNEYYKGKPLSVRGVLDTAGALGAEVVDQGRQNFKDVGSILSMLSPSKAYSAILDESPKKEVLPTTEISGGRKGISQPTTKGMPDFVSKSRQLALPPKGETPVGESKNANGMPQFDKERMERVLGNAFSGIATPGSGLEGLNKLFQYVGGMAIENFNRKQQNAQKRAMQVLDPTHYNNPANVAARQEAAKAQNAQEQNRQKLIQENMFKALQERNKAMQSVEGSTATSIDEEYEKAQDALQEFSKTGVLPRSMRNTTQGKKDIKEAGPSFDL